MVGHPADRLMQAVERCTSPACVGIDPVFDRLPGSVTGKSDTALEAVASFTREVLDAVAANVPIVKFQSACFERYGPGGTVVLEEAVGYARELGLQVILDVKRGDIGLTASHYAAAAARTGSDWVTANPYLGLDPVQHSLDAGLGAFALVRTSNPAGDAIQGQRLEDGRSVAESIADLVADAGKDSIGESGYSSLGAVVGATQGAEHVALRARMPQQVFLVPGFGAQGAGLDDVLGCFNSDGRGAIVTSSRSIIYAWDDDSDPGWQQCVADAAAAFADELGRAVGLRT